VITTAIRVFGHCVTMVAIHVCLGTVSRWQQRSLLLFSRETLELESQLDAAMRSRRAGTSRSDTETAAAQLQALEIHNTNLQVCTA